MAAIHGSAMGPQKCKTAFTIRIGVDNPGRCTVLFRPGTGRARAREGPRDATKPHIHPSVIPSPSYVRWSTVPAATPWPEPPRVLARSMEYTGVSAGMSRKNRRNYYRLLCIQPDAPLEVIRASYRTLMQSLKHHPDLGGDQWNAALLNEAYAVLSTPETRAAYDRACKGLEKTVGPTARTRARLVGRRGELERARSAQPPSREIIRPSICAFCNTRNQGSRQSVDGVCRGCGGPLRQLIGLTAGQLSRRAARRIEHDAAIHYRVDSSRSGSTPGRVIDLSPTGLGFVSPRPLRPGLVIKIDSATLSAIAKVTRSHTEPGTNLFATGAKFLTFRLRYPRGTFVSERV